MTIIYLLASVVLIIIATTKLKIHPFLALFVVAVCYGLVSGMEMTEISSAINDGFGGTLGKIGLIIVFGVIIGAFLEHTGGAMVIARKVLSWTGKEKVPFAMGILGYVVSIPVFCDSGYMLLHPLNKSLSAKAGISLAGSAVALGLGLMVSHVMVPPTPGPIAAAGILNADLGLVLLYALPVSLFGLFIGLLFARYVAAKTYISPGMFETPSYQESENRQPRFFTATLPILIPLLLIIIKSLVSGGMLPLSGGAVTLINFLGEPVMALFIGILLSLLLPEKLNKDMLSSNGWVGKAMSSSASILLITGAGGIFGTILQRSGIAEEIGGSLAQFDLGILLPFLIAAGLKSAQGSSTVSLITTASIVLPLMPSLGLETDGLRALTVLAIGAGAAVVSHANDSFFWVVTQMSGMNVKTGYKLFSLGTLVLGLSAALMIYVMSLFMG